MIENIDRLSIVSYDSNDARHRKFKNDLIKDEEFKRYFGDFFLKRVDDIFTDSEFLEVDKAYLVVDNETIIGMIRIFSYHEAGFINIQYAVAKECRNQGYGKELLREITKYFLNKNIKCISLDIDKNNIGSIKCALNVGYKRENNIYVLRKTNKNC